MRLRGRAAYAYSIHTECTQAYRSCQLRLQWVSMRSEGQLQKLLFLYVQRERF